MRLKGEEYSARLESYSTSTLKLMSYFYALDKMMVKKMHDITTDSTLSEAEVRSKLIELLNSTSTKKED